MDQFEKAAKFKALGMHAAAGRWEQTTPLLAELGVQAWRRKSLMGISPEEAAFDCVLKGAERPSSEWLRRIPSSPESAKALEERLAEAAKSGLGPDRGRSALAWLGALAGIQAPWERPFQALEHLPDLDANGFCKGFGDALAQSGPNARWGLQRGFWAVAGRASSDFKKSLAFSIERSGRAMRRPFSAASMGAPAIALQWIQGFSPESALALLAAAACSSDDEWEGFEALAPLAGVRGAKAVGVEGLGGLRSWSALAAHASGLQGASSLDELRLGWRSGPLAKPDGEKAVEGWLSALAALTARAAPLLDEPGMEGAKAWLGSALVLLDPQVARQAAPEMFDSVSFEGAMDREVDEAIEAAIAAQSPRLAALSAKAARRLHELAAEGARDPRRGGAAMREAAAKLWRAPDPTGFDAFMGALSELCPSADAALDLCGLPWSIGRPELAPGSAGQVVSLLRMADPKAVGEDGEGVWRSVRRDNVLAELWERSQFQAAMGVIDAGGTYASSWSSPAPASLGPFASWKSIDLADPKWGAGADAESVAAAWESAFEAIAIFAALVLEYPSNALPEHAQKASAPWRRGLAAMCLADPSGAAHWAALQWLRGGEASDAASRLCSGMEAPAKAALAAALPRAFEIRCSAWGELSKAASWNAARACREAASCLGAESDEPYSERESICAAAMAGASFGLALAMRGNQFNDGGAWRSLLSNGSELAGMMPEAASAICASADGPAAGADLVAKALWGALAMAPFGARFDASAWEGVRVDPSNPWVRSCLAAPFTKPAFDQGGGHVAEDVARAGAWLAGLGASGHERSPLGRSALEWALDCRATSKGGRRLHGGQGCFGEAAVKALVSLGADPSEPGAPWGEDAMALCVDMERKSSPSSIMKELAKSEKAAPWRGATWVKIATGKSTLSDKMSAALAGKARSLAGMESLSLLALEASHGRAGAILRAALAELPAADLAPGLLGAMARMQPPATALECHCAAKAIADAGAEPDEDSRAALMRSLASGLLRASAVEVDRELRGWIGAGALPARFDPSAATASSSKSPVDPGWALAWSRFGLGADCAVGELLLAKAAGPEGSAPPNLSHRDPSKLCEAALNLPEAFQGEMFGLACAKFIEAMQGSGIEDRMGSDSGKIFAALESRALRAAAAPKPAAAAPSKRI